MHLHIGAEAGHQPGPCLSWMGMELELTHAVLSWLSGRPCRSLSSLPEAACSLYCCCIFCQSCLPNTDCNGLERACSFAHTRQPAPSQGPSPRLFSPPQIEIRTCPVPSSLPARIPKLASPLGREGGICTSTPGNAQFQIVNGWTPCAIRIEARKGPKLLASLLFWIPHTGQTPDRPSWCMRKGTSVRFL